MEYYDHSFAHSAVNYHGFTSELQSCIDNIDNECIKYENIIKDTIMTFKNEKESRYKIIKEKFYLFLQESMTYRKINIDLQLYNTIKCNNNLNGIITAVNFKFNQIYPNQLSTINLENKEKIKYIQNLVSNKTPFKINEIKKKLIQLKHTNKVKKNIFSHFFNSLKTNLNTVLYQISLFDNRSLINYSILQFNKEINLSNKHNAEIHKILRKSNISKNKLQLYSNSYCKYMKKTLNVDDSNELVIQRYKEILKSLKECKKNTLDQYDSVKEKYEYEYNRIYNLFKDIFSSVEDEDDICPICLDINNTSVSLICNHKYHIECINKYIYLLLKKGEKEENIQCPYCRTKI